MNPMDWMKIAAFKKQLESNHPKVISFLKRIMGREWEEGTILELSVQRPGEEPICTNMKVTASDLEILRQLRELAKGSR